MICPECGQSNDKVIDSRAANEGKYIRRRRECLCCGKRFTTFEIPNFEAMMLEKAEVRLNKIKILIRDVAHKLEDIEEPNDASCLPKFE